MTSGNLFKNLLTKGPYEDLDVDGVDEGVDSGDGVNGDDDLLQEKLLFHGSLKPSQKKNLSQHSWHRLWSMWS